MAITTTTTPPSKPKPRTIHLGDRAALAAALRSPHPVLVHLNADTTWLLQLPYPAGVAPPAGRTRFNILIDPWLTGPQSDVAGWFSTQWHLIAPSVQTVAELDALLAEAEVGPDSGGAGPPSGLGSGQGREGHEKRSYIDVVALSHEFTDHCHEATLRELPRTTPVFATEKAAELVRSWRHFDTVVTTTGFSSETGDWRKTLSLAPLPDWVGIGRVITAGNALYYHSAIMVVFDTTTSAASGAGNGNAVVYSPHGIKGPDLQSVSGAGIRTLALLHGLHDVRIWMTKQLNLGAINGLEAVRASGARYWVATHDEVKKGGGFIAPLLRRTAYTLADAVRTETERAGGEVPDYAFVELGSGHGLVLV
ncbi:Uu.00g021250.m01.CDS01 [Anthostomella pinea]|uniref:Uu.00g021250.m01.CDS01 n=1 Tax=Anthostomella pinea TaxID=933095 RepID=A0AAI8VTT6_9PEZI|nr:Uu.00g021250.m01.CDS01 [Anthostomella pinea]